MKLYAANLYSENCIHSAELYSHLFGWKIEKSTKQHSELSTGSGLRIIFSSKSEICSVNPGSITIGVQNFEDIPKNLSGFKIETTSEHYISYLDQFQNRIWFYLVPKEIL
ncbi:MAG: hypothetical protein K8R21_00455 [Leptospira sp.]|nr:hypothetical protein [Leptospira sp.]